MSPRNCPLFAPNGLGTPFLFAQIRRRAPLQPVQPRAVLVDGGVATAYFRDWWRAAFPTREPMPRDAIAEKDGRGSLRLWDVLE